MSSKILFVVEPFTLAHVVRSAVLAKILCKKGYEIYFACDHYFDSALQNLILPTNFHRIPTPSRNPKVVLEILNKGGCLFEYSLLSDYMKNELKLIEEINPDLVFGDMRPSLAVSCNIAGVTHCSITNAYWTPHAKLKEFPLPCLGIPKRLRLSGLLAELAVKGLGHIYRLALPRIFESQGSGINKLRLEHGLLPYSDYLTGFTHGDHVCLLDLPELVPSELSLPSNHHYLGPVTWSANYPLPPWWGQLDQSKPIIYVSIGSSGDAQTIHSTLSALKNVQAQVIFATSNRIDLPEIDSNIFSINYLPGNLACDVADLVICNGGSPSIYQALISGKPILAIPHNMDQLLMSNYLVNSRAGISLRSDLVTEKSVLASVTNLLNNSKYKIIATQLKDKCSEFHIEDRFSELVKLLIAKDSVYERNPRVQSM